MPLFGDSNTYGINPKNNKRFDRDKRWTGRLQRLLGEGYYVIEEGLCGRTTVFEEEFDKGRSGLDYLPNALISHCPLDLVIIMLGTNDCKSIFNVSAKYIARCMNKLIKTTKATCYGFTDKVPKILIISPVTLSKDMDTKLNLFYDVDSILKSQQLAFYLERVAKQNGCLFFDAAKVASAGDDFIHIDEAGHEKISLALRDFILECE